jgi:hypothetical protein
MRVNTNAALTVVSLGNSQITVLADTTYDVDESPWRELLVEHPWVFNESAPQPEPDPEPEPEPEPEPIVKHAEAPVETASAMPGAKRNTRRGPQK